MSIEGETEEFVFMPEEFSKIPKHKLIPIVHSIWPSEVWILEKWKAHFMQAKTPFAVTFSHVANWGRSVQVRKLWKEDKTIAK